MNPEIKIESVQDVKAMLATAFTGASVVTAWLPAIEAILRIGVSLAGIAAGVYAALYWRSKRRRSERSVSDDDNPTTL